MANERFEIDGVWYDSLDDVPQPFRDSIAALLNDRDGDGVADVLGVGSGTYQIVQHAESYDVDGVSYASIDDVPEPQRSAIRQALGRSGEPSSAHRQPTSIPLGPPASGSRPSPIIARAGRSARTRLLVAFIAVDTLVAAVVIWFVVR